MSYSSGARQVPGLKVRGRIDGASQFPSSQPYGSGMRVSESAGSESVTTNAAGLEQPAQPNER